MISRLQVDLHRTEDGGPMVDAALIFTALLVLILGIIAFGSAYWAWNTMLLAVEEAGRYAMLYNPNTGYADARPRKPAAWPRRPSAAAPSPGRIRSAGLSSALSPAPAAVAASGSTITFTAQYNFNFIYPITLYRVMTYQLI